MRLEEPHSEEGRFTERRKIFRRLNMRVANDDDSYKRELDRELAQLVKLERKRGCIAHGFAKPIEDGAYFFDVPESFANFTGTEEPEDMMLQNPFSFAELEQLETDIHDCTAELARLMLAAASLSRRGND